MAWFADHLGSTAVGFCNGPDEAQPKPETWLRPVLVAAIKSLPDPREVLVCDAGPSIRDRNGDVVRARRTIRAEGHCPTARREFQRIVDQVCQRLAKPLSIRAHDEIRWHDR